MQTNFAFVEPKPSAFDPIGTSRFVRTLITRDDDGDGPVGEWILKRQAWREAARLRKLEAELGEVFEESY